MYPELNCTWEPPTPESLYQSFQATWDMIPSMQSDDNNFPFLYDRKVAEEGERYEVLPGLFGTVDNFYVDHIGAMWHGSQVWISNREFKAWYSRQGREQV